MIIILKINIIKLLKVIYVVLKYQYYNNGKNDSDNELNQNGSISKNGSDVAAGYFDTIKN